MFLLLAGLAFAQDASQLEQQTLDLKAARPVLGFSGADLPYVFGELFAGADVLIPGVVAANGRVGAGFNFTSQHGTTFWEKSGVSHAEVFVGYPLSAGVTDWTDHVTLESDVIEGATETTYTATVLPVQVEAHTWWVPEVGFKRFKGGPVDRMTSADNDLSTLHGYIGISKKMRWREYAKVTMDDGSVIEEVCWGDRNRSLYLVVGQGGEVAPFGDNPRYKLGNTLPVGVWYEKTDTAAAGGRLLATIGFGYVPEAGASFRFEMSVRPGSGRR